MERLQQAIELYHGDFLKDFSLGDSVAFEEWAMTTREQFHLRALEALRILADYHEGRGEYKQAQQFALRQVELEPWREVAHRQLMRVLVLSGQRSAALAQYETCRRLLTEELGVEPEAETLALVEQIRAGALVDMRPRIPLTQLPAPATPFVGREAERKRLSEYLAGQDQRLITLYGPGGSGKTRLALEIAAEQLPLWPDGVWFVPLAEVPTAEGLVDVLAAVLNLRVERAPLQPQQLIDFLRPKELLLILDSFEHLTVGAPLLRDIVRWAPQVRILVTSRARLGLQGEWAMQLGGLDVPPPPHPSPSEGEGVKERVGIESHSAVQLFVQSARRVVPDFTLSPENLPHVVRICHLVAGLPLGIELAAAWVRLFTCRQIADEIERSPDFLHNPGQNPSGRQHSLRATFEYSYGLLSDMEQALFRKLSVFHGGFTADAAHQVTGSGPSNLVSLLDKSLLQTSPSRRLDVHLTLRDYAAERLTQMPEEEQETRERHCRTYLPFVQKREEALWAENSKETLEEINVELGNVRAAWRWAVSQGKVEEIDASIRGLSRFYDLRGLLQEAAAAFESAADRVLALGANDIEAQRVAGRLLTEQARFLNRQGLYAQVVQVTQVAVELAQMSQDKLCEASATCSWGEALWRQGNHEEARAQLERALFLARVTRDAAKGPVDRLSQVVEMGSLNILGGLCWLQGDYAGAMACTEQALHIAVNAGSRQDEARFLTNLGVFAVEQGSYAEAEGIFQQSLHIQRAIGNRRSESLVLGNLGNVLLYLGAYAEAQTHYEQALRIQREIGAQKDEALSVGNLGLVYHYLGEHETARDYSQQALEIAQRIGDRRA